MFCIYTKGREELYCIKHCICFYCCIPHCHKFSGFKQHPFTISKICHQEDWVLRLVSHNLEPVEEEFTSKLIQVLAKSYSCDFRDPNFPDACKLEITLPARAHMIPYPMAPSLFKTVMVHHILAIFWSWHFLLPPAEANSVFKRLYLIEPGPFVLEYL